MHTPGSLGRQTDTSTPSRAYSWQVDRNSAAYYAFASRPAVKTALDAAPAHASNPRAAPSAAAPAHGASNTRAAATAPYRGSTEELTSMDTTVTGMDPDDEDDVVASGFRRGPPRNREARDSSPGPLGPGRASSSRFRR